MKVRKILALFLVIAFVAISSISAKEYNFYLQAYVAENVTIELTSDGYRVISNTSNITYDLNDINTDTYKATIVNVISQ